MAKETSGNLFSAEEMTRIMGGFDFKDSGPVTCLGIEFENNEARRAYFCEELRKRLPELKKMEGFPIGTDDDIINLSDPPYFTACPNPWLDKLISLWEQEKENLQREGKRKKDFDVKDPYAYGIKQGKNSAIYNAHTYHTKVPHEVIMRYILHYTQPGDIILDSFAGTGMTGFAASACSNVNDEIEQDFKDNGYKKPVWGMRHAICGDLSPICYHISSNYNHSIDTVIFKGVIESVCKELHKKFDVYYELDTEWGISHVNYFVWSKILSCSHCGNELNVHNLSFNYETNTLYEKLTCPNCGASQDKNEADRVEVTYYDDFLGISYPRNKYECCLMNLSTKKHGRQFSTNIPTTGIEKTDKFVPTNYLGETEKWGDTWRLGSHIGFSRVHNFYPPRTLNVLSFLRDLIYCKYSAWSKELMFVFTSMLPKLTMMNRYMPQHGSRALVGPMANTMYVPPICVENNPIDQFEYQAKKVIKAYEECKNGAAVQIASATNTSIPDNSIDYIFTDPPFGANIMYSELNALSESWIKLRTNNKEEAISNESQHKGFVEYQNIMTKCFKEYYRVLKPGGWMTVEFSNTSAAVWNSLQYSIKEAGFVISAITDLNKERGGLHAMIGPISVKQDLAISCYKPTDDLIKKISDSNPNSVWDFVDEHLRHVAKFISKNGRAVTVLERDPRIIYDRIISYYVQQGLTIPIDSQEFQEGLRERYIERDGMFFTADQAADYDERKRNTVGIIPMGIIVSDEANGIEWLKNHLRNNPKTYSEIHPDWMQAINGLRKGDILPELRDILEENFIEEANGKWRIADPEKQADLDKLYLKNLLREFNVYVEAVNKPKAKPIKQVRIEAVRAGFKDCYKKKDFATIIKVGDKIPQNLLQEDEQLLRYYDVATRHV